MKTYWTLSILGLFSLLAGCETVPVTSAQQLEQVKAQGKARVVAPHSTFWAGLDIGTHIDMSIMSVDGRSQGHDELELPAGRHQLGVSCNYAQTMSVLSHPGGGRHW